MKGLILVLIPFLTPAGNLQERTGVIAEVNGEVITRRDLEKGLRLDPRYLELRRSYQGQALQRRAGKIMKQTLDRLVERKLIKQEIKKQGITLDRADETEVERLHKRTIERFGSEENYRKALGQSGLTVDDELEQIRLQLLLEKLRRQAMGPEHFIRPEEIRDFYRLLEEEIASKGSLKDEKADFCRKGSLRVRQIKLAGDDLELARRIRAEAIAGKDFGELAMAHSKGPHREDGGLWAFEGDEAPFTSKRADAISILQAGEVTPVIEERDHYYILKLESRERTHLKSFDQVQEKIHQSLSIKKRIVRHREWFEDLVDKAHIVYHPLDEASQ